MIKSTIAAALFSLSALLAVPAQATSLTIDGGSGWSGAAWHGSDGERRRHGSHHRRYQNKLSSDEVRMDLALLRLPSHPIPSTATAPFTRSALASAAKSTS